MQKGGGIIIALCLLIGAGVGIAVGESSIGFLGGLAVGIVIAAVMAWRDSRAER